MRVDLTQFSINRATIEIRFSRAFLLWDRAGMIWHEISRHYPKLSIDKAQPNQITARLTDTLIAEVSAEKAHLETYAPEPDASNLGEAASPVFNNLVRALEITDLTRIGFRVFFEKRFNSKDAADEFALEHDLFPKPEGKHFNISGRLKDPELSVRWEGDTTGCYVRFDTGRRKLEAQVPPIFRGIELPSAEVFVAALDVDYYVHAITPVSRFEPKGLIAGWMHAIRRDLQGFING